MNIEDYEPTFGVVIQCLVTGHNETLFVLQQLRTVQWNQHFHAFEVQETDYIIVLKYDNFMDHHPLLLSKKQNQSFVCIFNTEIVIIFVNITIDMLRGF